MGSVLILRRNYNLERILRRYMTSGSPLHIDNAIVLTKMTRYEVERHCNPNLNERQLEKLFRSRGSDYDSLVEHHFRHKNYEAYVLEAFKHEGINTKVLNRLDYHESWVESCDAVFPVGGDGTFLLGASRVRQNTTPVIGFNSDPHHSEGFLCLNQKYSHRVRDVLQHLKEGSFQWMFRSRIRVSIKSKENESASVKVEDKKVLGPHRTKIQLGAKNMSTASWPQTMPRNSHYLALNEVFVGECLSAQVSYFEMRIPPEAESTKVKSSGICISTGTGSTSWHLSMNRVSVEGVARTLMCAGVFGSDCEAVAKKYNDSLLFDPEDSRMCYTIRDLISAGVWPSPPGLAPRGFADAMLIRSRCRDARLVVDGGTSFTFNDGSEALFLLLPEDALRTVVL